MALLIRKYAQKMNNIRKNFFKGTGKTTPKESSRKTIGRDKAWVETDGRSPEQDFSTQAIFELKLLW